MLLQEVDDLTRLSCDVEIARIGKRAPPVRREFFHFLFPCFPPYFQVLSLLWRARGIHPRGHCGLKRRKYVERNRLVSCGRQKKHDGKVNVEQLTNSYSPAES